MRPLPTMPLLHPKPPRHPRKRPKSRLRAFALPRPCIELFRTVKNTRQNGHRSQERAEALKNSVVGYEHPVRPPERSQNNAAGNQETRHLMNELKPLGPLLNRSVRLLRPFRDRQHAIYKIRAQFLVLFGLVRRRQRTDVKALLLNAYRLNDSGKQITDGCLDFLTDGLGYRSAKLFLFDRLSDQMPFLSLRSRSHLSDNLPLQCSNESGFSSSPPHKTAR